MVCYKVMHIVATPPPTNGETAAEVRNEHAYQRVNDMIVCYASVSRIVGGEHDPMLRNLDGVS